MKRKVAYIGKIVDIQPIKGADFIESATVVCGEGGKWMGTIPKKKGLSMSNFAIGELVEVYLQDAILPNSPEFDFMEKYKYRVSMRRFKKVPSECLIWKIHPMTDNPQVGDVIPGIGKYEKPIPAQLAGQVVGGFPTSIIPKTDEPNFQTVPDMILYLSGQPFYSTVKADGSSGTAFNHNNGDFGVCSRNLQLKDDGKNAFWEVVKRYDIPNKLPNDYAIQFELCGPGIQKNHLGLDKLDMRVFNLYDIRKRRYLDAEDLRNFCAETGIPMVQIIDWNKPFMFKSDEELRKYAEGKYDSGYQREGVVIRPMKESRVNGERLSFKIINLLFKDA